MSIVGTDRVLGELDITTMPIEGVRVVRGPDWSLGDSDGGEGHMGTVIKVNHDHSVEVQWDMGKQTKCRTGKESKYDLRVLDSASAGVKHRQFNCDGRDCHQTGITGIRWRCAKCPDFDLCARCYFKDQHNIQHPFTRFDAPGLSGGSVPARSKSARLRSWGVFEDAMVKRGPNWSWGNQDGGKGSVGTVLEIFTNASFKGGDSGVAAKVRWPNSSVNNYRIGIGGNVDLICVEAAPGTDYYRDHLLSLKTVGVQMLNRTLSRETSCITGVDSQSLKKGDKVCIQIPEVALKEVQKGHGGWTAAMAEYVGQHGVVKTLIDGGDVSVAFDDREWRLSHSAVRKVPTVKVGNTVRILDDKDKVQAMQKRHGGWAAEMTQTLGKVGKVVKIDSDGDVAVAFGGSAFVYNAACCLLVSDNTKVDAMNDTAPCSNSDAVGGSIAGKDDDDDDDDKDGAGDHLAQLLAQLFLLGATGAKAVGPQQFVSAAANNNTDAVKSLMQRQPDIVNTKVQGLTALIIASHEGHADVVRILLKGKAELDATEEKGNSALMAALIKKREGVAKLLMDAGANVTIRNKNGANALHLAALNGANATLQLLVRKKCNANEQDSDGDTPIHCAVHKSNSSGTAILLTVPHIDIALCNNNGHNPIRLATMKNDEESLSKLLDKAPQLLNTPSADGSTPMHVAAINNNMDVLNTLVQRNAKVDATDDNKLTPLHLACHQGYVDAPKCLVEAGASLTTSDKDGDTALHLCLMGSRHRGDMDALARLMGITVTSADEIRERIKLASFLIESGADVTAKNKKGGQPLQCCSNDQLRNAVKQFIDSRSGNQTGIGAITLLQGLFPNMQMPCVVDECDKTADVIFQPCGHKVCCRRCSVRLEECPICDQSIAERRSLDGQPINADPCRVQ